MAPSGPVRRYATTVLECVQMCWRWESNPQPLRDTILSRARIPVPPLQPALHTNIFTRDFHHDTIARMNDETKYVPTRYDSVFWIDTDKIHPNPYQPRRDFKEEGLKSLAESIRQYGLLQPLTVTRRDVEREDGGLGSEYELIAGERRLRASKLIGLKQVPVVIRYGESNLTKLELAILENIQREDLNPVDRAKALQQLIQE